ncbi:MAG: hypothetical protein AB2761_20980 [Candidatus Thiodiazotropha endolucinida]
MATLLTLSAIPDIYVDAYLADDSGNLIFLSVWGRDTALQELLGRLQLPRSDNGIREFNLIGTGHKKLVRVPNVNELGKVSSKSTQTIFGVLSQLWIYDNLAVRPDIANSRALILHDPGRTVPDPWPVVKTVCPLPLLDSWKEIILRRFIERQWIRPLTNGAGIAGMLIELDEDLESMMTDMIHRSELTLPANI